MNDHHDLFGDQAPKAQASGGDPQMPLPLPKPARVPPPPKADKPGRTGMLSRLRLPGLRLPGLPRFFARKPATQKEPAGTPQTAGSVEKPLAAGASVRAAIGALLARVPRPAPRKLLAGLFSTKIGKSGSRIRLVALGFAAVYMVIGGKLVWLGTKPEADSLRRQAVEASSRPRPDIHDRNGEVLATDVRISSVYAEPRRLIDKEEAIEQLSAALPDLDPRKLRRQLMSRRGFVWVKRGVTPQEWDRVFKLGLPGVGRRTEFKRVYPNGPVAAHVLGFTNIDNIGIAGLEKYIDTTGLSALRSAGFNFTHADLKPVRTSIDLRATHALRDELQKGLVKFKAKAAAAAIMDVKTGEIVALASLPDYDPNNPVDALEKQNINRMSVGVFEMGSTFKALTVAMALDAGKVNIRSMVNASKPLSFGRFRIRDYHGKYRPLSVAETFVYSSNIATAKLALMMGVPHHKAFLNKLGQTTRMRTELPESASPILPRRWEELSTATIAFGHGLAVAPLQAMMAVSALVNGGHLVKPTFLHRPGGGVPDDAPRVLSEATSEKMRYIMRLNAEVGSARKANVKGYFPGGKTGTAEKVINGRYSNNVVFTTFTAIAPADEPRYLFLTIYDEPKGIPETHGYRTAAWNAGYVTGKIIERVSPLLGLPPRKVYPPKPFPVVARTGRGLPSNGRKWH